jgi:hypothetical protein
MPLLQHPDQARENLRSFYTQDQWTGAYREMADSMLAFLDMMDELFPETMIWGMTSHLRIGMMSAPEQTNWHIIVAPHTGNSFFVEYLLPEAKAPWDNAWVRGEADNFESLKKYTLIAMKESGFWEGNKEVAKQLDSFSE